MKIEELAKIYAVKNGYREAEVNFEIDGKAFHIAKNDLSNREILLFECLFKQEISADFEQLTNGNYRILQIRAKNFAEVADNLSLIIPSVVKVIKFDEKSGIAIEKYDKETLSWTELTNVVKALAQDLSFKIDLYIGFFTEKSELAQIYAEEKLNFANHQTFSEAMIAKNLEKSQSLILNKLKTAFQRDIDSQELVKVLYQNDGNQLKTAKDLYIHRNTLTQKIKKFEKQYGISLTSSDLVLLKSLI
ncbi:hypothetical protein Hs30E_05840 [Lactococcus hodotermopsidis]|uniref:PucR C-terminal helix-turn-helix domain-containing protein n=1 Tax=Pseudolactococcus hodotermopsidis TaxID=2709157 RepID=A0A6A0BBI0_9LACT|nr:helix-turn-helix domain-containing protein [Lactococcus hodotermopsidis]GFH42033.1 hypothetical protein Hs30E_05840 [Lactococcus hodotermopsidis]